MNLIIRIHIAVLVCLASVAMAGETTLYVARSGDDANAGTQDAPFKTLTRARAAVRASIKAGHRGPLTVQLAGGTYAVTEPVVFGPDDCAPDGSRVTYAAAPGESVFLSGGRRVTQWQVETNGTWTATLPAASKGRWVFRQLFVNGERRPRARHPNSDYLRVDAVGEDRRTNFTFHEGDLPALASWSGAELVFLHDWSISRLPIKSVDQATLTLTTAGNVGPVAKHYKMDHYEKRPRYFIENLRALLDAPGEWFLDSGAGVLHYNPMPGEEPDKINAVAPVATGLLTLKGDSVTGRKVRNLTFRDIVFAHAAWPFPGRYAAGQAAFHEEHEPTGGLRVPLPAAIQLTFADGCRFESCELSRSGASGLWIGAGSSSNVVSRCHIHDIGGNGVMIGEDNNRRVNGNTWWRAAPAQAATGNVIEDCLIERCGRQFFGAVGVWSGMTRRTMIRNNEIRDLPYTGISLGWIWNLTPSICGGNVVEANHIHDILKVLSDGGGIYTLGRQPGTVLTGNLIHGVSANRGRAESNGMFLDQGTADIEISGNVIHDTMKSPLRFHQAGTNLVSENVLVTPKSIPHIRYNRTPESNIVQRANIVTNKLPDSVQTARFGPR